MCKVIKIDISHPQLIVDIRGLYTYYIQVSNETPNFLTKYVLRVWYHLSYLTLRLQGTTFVLPGKRLEKELISLILVYRPGINDVDIDGTTILHFAAGNRQHIGAVRLLLSKGADIHIKDFKGNIALHEAGPQYLF